MHWGFLFIWIIGAWLVWALLQDNRMLGYRPKCVSGGLVVRLPFDPCVELVPVDAGAVSHGNAERRPIGTFVVLITVARPCGSRRVGLSFLSRGK